MNPTPTPTQPPTHFTPPHPTAAAEMCAERLGISREEQDAHAIASVERARQAAQAGLLDWEVVPLEVPARDGGVRLFKEVRALRACPLLFPAAGGAC